MTSEEIKKLPWAQHENYALVNTETNSIMIGSDTIDFCIETKKKMGINHPLYNKLEIVERPK
jgi:hypothetical protein